MQATSVGVMLDLRKVKKQKLLEVSHLIFMDSGEGKPELYSSSWRSCLSKSRALVSFVEIILQRISIDGLEVRDVTLY